MFVFEFKFDTKCCENIHWIYKIQDQEFMGQIVWASLIKISYLNQNFEAWPNFHIAWELDQTFTSHEQVWPKFQIVRACLTDFFCKLLQPRIISWTWNAFRHFFKYYKAHEADCYRWILKQKRLRFLSQQLYVIANWLCIINYWHKL